MLDAEPTRVQTLGENVARQRRTRWVRSSLDGSQLVCGIVSNDVSVDPIIRTLPAVHSVRSWRTHDLLAVYSTRGAFAVERSSITIDDLDRSIMRLLADDGRSDDAALAKRLRVAASTAARRRTRLEEHGILYYEADVDHRRFDRPVDAMLWLDLAPGAVDECGRALCERPECRFVAAISGEWSLAVNIAVATRAEVVAFVDQHLVGYGVCRRRVTLLGTTFKRSGA